MGWAGLLGMTAITGGVLWRFARLPGGGLELLGAALLMAVAGYAWQGSPSLAGQTPAAQGELRRPDSAFAELRGTMMPSVGSDADLLTAADSFARNGLDAYGVGILRGALARTPNRPDLWVGLGNALVQHSKGLVTPAAEFAFTRAARLSPTHPAPPFFLGLAYYQMGKTDRARELWTPLLASTPDGAPWKPMLVRAIGLLDEIEGGV